MVSFLGHVDSREDFGGGFREPTAGFLRAGFRGFAAFEEQFRLLCQNSLKTCGTSERVALANSGRSPRRCFSTHPEVIGNPP